MPPRYFTDPDQYSRVFMGHIRSYVAGQPGESEDERVSRAARNFGMARETLRRWLNQSASGTVDQGAFKSTFPVLAELHRRGFPVLAELGILPEMLSLDDVPEEYILGVNVLEEMGFFGGAPGDPKRLAAMIKRARELMAKVPA